MVPGTTVSSDDVPPEASDATLTGPSATYVSKPAKRAYLLDVNVAKGLAIFLVVYGHLVTGTPPVGNAWYMLSRAAIYAFHMPFFIYLSGYMLIHAYPDIGVDSGKISFLLRRAERLLVPFIVFGITIVVGKAVFVNLMHVDRFDGDLSEGLLNLFWHTRDSPAKSVWYIFVVFEMTALVVLLRPFFPRLLVPLAIALPLSVFAYPPLVYFDKLMMFLPYFFIGAIAAMNRERWEALIDKRFWLALATFLAAILVSRIVHIYAFSVVVCGLASIPALHGLCRRPLLMRNRTLAWLGGYSFVIYLLNTVAIGLVKGIMLKFLGWNHWHFLLFAPALLVGGLLGPIIVKRLVFDRSRYLARLTS